MSPSRRSCSACFRRTHRRSTGSKGAGGRFRHVHVDRDEYAVHLCRYLHLNPVAAGLVAHPAEWPYSNYLEWVEARSGSLVDLAFVRCNFGMPDAYATFVRDRLDTEQGRRLRPYLLEGDDLPPGSELSGRVDP
jgi:hypothetical protein